MLFVTVGSQKFQFNRLIKAVDAMVASGVVADGAFAQTGACTYRPERMNCEAFLDRESFHGLMEACDTVITHGGTGAIISAVKAGKKVISVPRLAVYGEHVDDHQKEIVTQFANMGLIEPCMDPADLRVAYLRTRTKAYLSYKSNTKRFVADLAGYIDAVGDMR